MPLAIASRIRVEEPDGRLRLAPRTMLLAGLGLIAAQLLLRGVILGGSWFYFDDLAFMSRAMDQSLGSSYLLESYGGHLMPAGFALIWVLTRVAVYTWWAWAVVLLAMHALAGYGMLRLLRSMFGDTPVVLALLCGYLFWVFTLPAGIWFAAGINQLPLQIALTFGLHAHLAYLRTRRRSHLVATLAWTVGGLLFYEKSLLLFGVYAIVALGWFSTGNTAQRLEGLWHRYRAGVVAHAVVAVAYLVFYVRYGLDFSPGAASTTPWTPLAYGLVLRVLVPGLVGGPLTWRPVTVGALADPSQLVMVLAWVAVGGVAYYAHRTRTHSLRAWWLLAFTLFANVLLLSSARASLVGPDIALELRYQTESAAMAALAIGLAFLPLRGAVEHTTLRPDVPRTYEAPRLVAAATVGVLALAAVSTYRYAVLWQSSNRTESFVGQVERTVADAGTRRVPAVDGSIPQDLLWAYRYPENSYSHVFRNLSPRLTFPTTAVDRLFVFDDRGRLRPAKVPSTRAMEPVTSSSTTSGSRCVGSTSGDAIEIPLDGPVIGGPWWVRLEYDAEADTRARVRAGDETHEVSLPSGEHALYFTASGDFDTIDVESLEADSSDLCVQALDLGQPVPGSAS